MQQYIVKFVQLLILRQKTHDFQSQMYIGLNHWGKWKLAVLL